MATGSSFLEKTLRLRMPPIGLYDAPDRAVFEPVVEPKPGARTCVFAFFRQWIAGKTLRLAPGSFGCGGAGSCLFGVAARSREDHVKFLADDEGLKASHDLMDRWLDRRRAMKPEHGQYFIGPLRGEAYGFLKTVTFWADPDQLSILAIGAQYHADPGDPAPVIAPFGSGCMQLGPLFEDLGVPQAIIGATDIAMRRYIDPDLLAFTATRPMYERLCSLDGRSFLGKRFLADLRKARGEASGRQS